MSSSASRPSYSAAASAGFFRSVGSSGFGSSGLGSSGLGSVGFGCSGPAGSCGSGAISLSFLARSSSRALNWASLTLSSAEALVASISSCMRPNGLVFAY
ncbi:hypothetical protein FKW78_18945 [Mycolicibacterium fortuitum]|nr:hypothetical protein FKW78_18945 [Mycolicibacterium fortuitum]